MTIRSIEAIPLGIGFKQTFRFGTVDRTRSQNVVVRITTEDGVVGYGEACPVRAFTAETQQTVVALIDERVREVVVGQNPTLVRPILRALAPRLVHCPFTLAAVDIALWDLAGKLLGVPVSTLLGGRLHDRIEVHGSVGWDRPEAMAEAALAQLAAGYRTLKLYAGRDDLDADLDRLAAVRAAIGPDPRLIVDVNGLWSVSQCLRALPRLEGLGVVLLEQPVAAWDGPGQAEVVRASRIDVCADEAVYGPEDVARIGRERTARTINLGLSKLGGLARARECEVVARAVGLGVTVGSVLELGIATAAGLHLAAAVAAPAYPAYLVGPLKYETDFVSPAVAVSGGEIAVPEGPGLGLAVDEERLAPLDLRR